MGTKRYSVQPFVSCDNSCTLLYYVLSVAGLALRPTHPLHTYTHSLHTYTHPLHTYTHPLHTYTHTEEIPFSSTTDYSVHEATLHTPTSKLVFVEHPHTPHTSHSSQVTVRSLDYPSNGSVDLGPPKVILRNSPPFKLTCFEEGIALLPTTTPYPKGTVV